MAKGEGSQEGLDLVVLNACYSQEQAQAIADAVGHVVAMEGSILDQDAIDLLANSTRLLEMGGPMTTRLKELSWQWLL